MKGCPTCGRIYDDDNRFCRLDGAQLEEYVQSHAASDGEDNKRHIPAPPKPLPLRLTIVDADDEGKRSRVIAGKALDLGRQGMRIQTGTVETGELNIVRDHTVAFKNILEIELDLPEATVRLSGFAAWYKPAGDGINWMVGVYIRDMPAADRKIYEKYLHELAVRAGNWGVVAES